MWLFLWITLSFWTLLFPGFFKGMYMIYALMMLTDNNNNNSSNIELSCEPRQQLPDAHRLYGYGERQAVGWSGLRAGWIDAHECQDLSICITYERVNWKSIQVCEGLYCLPSPETTMHHCTMFFAMADPSVMYFSNSWNHTGGCELTSSPRLFAKMIFNSYKILLMEEILHHLEPIKTS